MLLCCNVAEKFTPSTPFFIFYINAASRVTEWNSLNWPPSKNDPQVSFVFLYVIRVCMSTFLLFVCLKCSHRYILDLISSLSDDCQIPQIEFFSQHMRDGCCYDDKHAEEQNQRLFCYGITSLMICINMLTSKPMNEHYSILHISIY